MKRQRLFTAKEAAALLGMTYEAFDSYVRRHKIPTVRTNHHRRFSKEAIDAIRAQREKAGR